MELFNVPFRDGCPRQIELVTKQKLHRPELEALSVNRGHRVSCKWDIDQKKEGTPFSKGEQSCITKHAETHRGWHLLHQGPHRRTSKASAPRSIANGWGLGSPVNASDAISIPLTGRGLDSVGNLTTSAKTHHRSDSSMSGRARVAGGSKNVATHVQQLRTV